MSPRPRKRVLLGVLLIYIAGIAFLLYHVLADVDPRYRESAEDSLVESAQLMAALLEQDVEAGTLRTGRVEALMRSATAREFEARIFGHAKTRIELRVIVTDATGLVLYDSLGRAQGTDFGQWRDIVLALRGQYGARTTPEQAGDPESSVMYVAAPVRWQGATVGAVSVGKPVRSFGPFVEAARRNTLHLGIVSALGALLLAVIVSFWLVRPFGLVADYARYLRTRPGARQVLRATRIALRGAFHDMREALAGRSYITDYVQTLTHELKSPLSAIRGAAELLEDERMPPAERRRFLDNIGQETHRMQEVVDRMLELAALEARRRLAHVERVALADLLAQAVAATEARAAPRGVVLALESTDPGAIDGDPFLLRRALQNLLDNAVDFSPPGGCVRAALRRKGRHAVLTVRDEGPGIPAYAQERLFEKFYSLPRPATGRKGTGLGLAFVRQIAALHGGDAALANAPQGGAEATLRLPLSR